MEERRIIKSGPGSYVVTVPVDWVRKNKLGKGSTVYVKEDTTNAVLVYPKFREINPEKRTVSVDSTEFSLDETYNSIISSYLNNAKTISVKNLKKEHLKEIKQLITILPGLSIAEQSSGMLLIEDMLDTNSVNILQTIRRIDMMLRNMLTDLITSEDTSLIEIDQNIFGQSLFVKRMLKHALRDPAVMNAIDLNAEKIVEYIMIVDQLENISNQIRKISEEKITKSQHKEYYKIFKVMQEQYLNAVNSFYNNDRKLSTEVFRTKTIIYAELKAVKSPNHNINSWSILMDKSCRIIARITFDKWRG